MQDMGAGGLLCSSLELVQRGREKFKRNFGCEIYLDRVPCKEGLSHSDILISESQERMLLCCENDYNYSMISNLCNKWDLECTVIGKVTEDGNYTVYDNDKIVYNAEIENFTSIEQDWDLVCYGYSGLRKTRVSKLLWEQYDNTLGGRTIKGPLEEGSYSILDLHEIGKKLYITWGSTFNECGLKMQKFNVKNRAIVNCMNFGHPKDSMGDFDEIIDGLARKCEYNKTPVIGGNVSLYNCTNDVSIPPSPVFMMIGIER